MASLLEKNTPAIEIQQVSKRFEEIQALAGVSFNIPANGVFCVLGPNGAGKTTLLKILTTVTRPDAGEVLYFGSSIFRDALSFRHQLGVVAQENRFEKYLTIWHNLAIHAKMHGMRRAEYEPRIQELLEKVSLWERRNATPNELSGGMQRRVALMRAILHRPKVLFLDEPTTGLDPQARSEIWETIEALKTNATVILTTHYMEEADRLSDQVLMLHKGQVVMEGTARELKARISPGNQYRLKLKTPTAEKYRELLSTKLSPHLKNPYELALTPGHFEDLPALLSAINAEDFDALGLLQADLEEVFMSVVNSEGNRGENQGGQG